MSLNKISSYQLTNFVACSIASNGIMIFREMFRQARQDAWLCFFLPMVYALIILLISTYLLKGESVKNLLQLNKLYFGILGNVINAFLFLYVLFLLGMEINKLTYTIKYYLLPRTPLAILAVTLIFAITYLAYTGIEVIVRFGNLVFIPYLFTIFSLPLMLFNEIEVSNILPIASDGLEPILKGSFFQMALFGEIFLYVLVLGNSNEKRGFYERSFVRGTILGTFLLTFVAIMAVITAGVPIISHGYIAPNFLVQLVHIAEFMDRFDLFLFSTWLLSYLIRMVFFYYVLGASLSSIGKEVNLNKDYFILLIPLVFIISQLFFTSQIQTTNFENYAWQLLTIGIQVPLLLVLTIKKWIRSSVLNE